MYLYNGKEKDATDLYYYGVRYYDPGVGRFLTRDPLSGDLMSPQTLNQYVYCLNNPLKYIDPKGMAADKMNLQYVILPDGTISHELADLINKLDQTLGNLSEEEWAKITEYLSDKNKETKIASRTKALLMILDAAGIKYDYDISAGEYYIKLGTTKFYFEFRDSPVGLWGEIQSGDNESIKSIVFADWIPSVEDLYMTIGHELIHAYMIGYHGDTIASIEEYYGKDVGVAYMELISYDWQFNMLNKVPGVSDYLKTTIEEQYKKYSHFWEIIENNPK